MFVHNGFQQSMQAINFSPVLQGAGLLSNYSIVSTMKLSMAPELLLNGPQVFRVTAKMKSSVLSIRRVLVHIVSQPNINCESGSGVTDWLLGVIILGACFSVLDTCMVVWE